jgi:hypothetical protein
MGATYAVKRTVDSQADVHGLNVQVAGNADPGYKSTFRGHYSSALKTLGDLELWNFTYHMPSELVGTLSFTLDLDLW